MSPTPEQLASELDRLLAQRTREGWEIISRSTASAQLRRRPASMGCGIIGFILVPLLLGVLLHQAFFTLALIGLVVVGIAAALRKEEIQYISEEDVRQRLMAEVATSGKPETPSSPASPPAAGLVSPGPATSTHPGDTSSDISG